MYWRRAQVRALGLALLLFEPVQRLSADTAGIVGVLNLDNGVLTPIATGFGSTRGMVFVSEDDRDRR